MHVHGKAGVLLGGELSLELVSIKNIRKQAGQWGSWLSAQVAMPRDPGSRPQFTPAGKSSAAGVCLFFLPLPSQIIFIKRVNYENKLCARASMQASGASTPGRAHTLPHQVPMSEPPTNHTQEYLNRVHFMSSAGVSPFFIFLPHNLYLKKKKSIK